MTRSQSTTPQADLPIVSTDEMEQVDEITTITVYAHDNSTIVVPNNYNINQKRLETILEEAATQYGIKGTQIRVRLASGDIVDAVVFPIKYPDDDWNTDFDINLGDIDRVESITKRQFGVLFDHYVKTGRVLTMLQDECNVLILPATKDKPETFFPLEQVSSIRAFDVPRTEKPGDTLPVDPLDRQTMIDTQGVPLKPIQNASSIPNIFSCVSLKYNMVAQALLVLQALQLPLDSIKELKECVTTTKHYEREGSRFNFASFLSAFYFLVADFFSNDSVKKQHAQAQLDELKPYLSISALLQFPTFISSQQTPPVESLYHTNTAYQYERHICAWTQKITINTATKINEDLISCWRRWVEENHLLAPAKGIIAKQGLFKQQSEESLATEAQKTEDPKPS